MKKLQDSPPDMNLLTAAKRALQELIEEQHRD